MSECCGRSKILRRLGTTLHTVGGEPVPGEAVVEIRNENGLFYLMRLDGRGACIADTCHLTLEEAKAQAQFEYELDGEWVV